MTPERQIEELKEENQELNDRLEEWRLYADVMHEGLEVLGRAMYTCLNHPNANDSRRNKKFLEQCLERLGKDTTHQLAQDDSYQPYDPIEPEVDDE